MKGGSLDKYNDLALALKRNQEKRGNLLSYLEQKYAGAEDSDNDLVVSGGSKKRPAKPAGQKSRTKRKKT